MSTIEVEIWSSYQEMSAKAAVPSGKSTGSNEAFEIRDADGGVLNVIENVEKLIAPKIIGKIVDAEEIDHLMLALDITSNKKYIGANAMLGVSMAMHRLEAKMRGMPLWQFISKKGHFEVGKPRLYMNTLNGGAHADFRLPFQEYILVVGGETLAESNKKAQEVFQRVKEKLDSEKSEYYMGDEGGFAPRFEDIEKPFEILSECIKNENDIFIAIDAAASEFYKNGKYEILGKQMSTGDLLMEYKSLVEKFNLRSIEDPFEEKDYDGFEKAVRWMGESVLIVGDDLTTTNPITIKKLGARGLANAIIIKPNQIGTIFETFEAIREARNVGWKIIVSHRSGETMDSFISDLAVGVGAYGIKAGAHTQPERLAKYDRLIEIEKEMAVSDEEERIKREKEEERKKHLSYF
jgi:enolase